MPRFTDVSDEPAIEDRALDTRGQAEALRALGFETVGYVEDGMGQTRPVYEVLADSERRCFALPEDLFGKPHVVYRTLLDDGTIVETAFERAGGLKLVPAPRVAQPFAGYALRRAPRDAEAAWEAHRAHVEEVARVRRSDVGPHDDVALYIAMGERATTQLRARSLTNVLVVSTVMVAAVLLLPSFGRDGSIPRGALLAAFLGLGYLTLWLSPGRWLPMRRVPRDELV